MDFERIRGRSVEQARAFGIDIPNTLPLLDPPETRPPDDVLSRIFAMHGVAAAAYGFQKARAIAWLDREGVTAWLSTSEREFLAKDGKQGDKFRAQIEGMWALCWAIGVVHELDFAKDCDSRFVMVLPNLKENTPGKAFRSQANPRPIDELAQASDLAYCLHWGIRQAELTGGRTPARLKPWVVIERRRALEWLTSAESWDDVTLDT